VTAVNVGTMKVRGRPGHPLSNAGSTRQSLYVMKTISSFVFKTITEMTI